MIHGVSRAGAGALVLSIALPATAAAASGHPNGATAPNCTSNGGAGPAADSECASGWCYEAPTTGFPKTCVAAGCAGAGNSCVTKACCVGTCVSNKCQS